MPGYKYIKWKVCYETQFISSDFRVEYNKDQEEENVGKANWEWGKTKGESWRSIKTRWRYATLVGNSQAYKFFEQENKIAAKIKNGMPTESELW